jgi:hypothetical protein
MVTSKIADRPLYPFAGKSKLAADAGMILIVWNSLDLGGGW